jgi:hypothetical protein
MVYLQSAEYVSDYKIALVFNTGEQGVVNLVDIPSLFEVAKPLEDLSVFQSFFLDEWPTLAWPCGFDLAPEMLYERVTGKR